MFTFCIVISLRKFSECNRLIPDLPCPTQSDPTLSSTLTTHLHTLFLLPFHLLSYFPYFLSVHTPLLYYPLLYYPLVTLPLPYFSSQERSKPDTHATEIIRLSVWDYETLK